MIKLKKIRSTIKIRYIIFVVLIFATIYISFVCFLPEILPAIMLEIMMMVGFTYKFRKNRAECFEWYTNNNTIYRRI